MPFLEKLAINDELGEIKFQSNDKANVFFAATINHDDINRGFPYTNPITQQIPPTLYLFSVREGYQVGVSRKSTVIQGYYKDLKFERENRTSGHYQVMIYLWYEEEEEEDGL